MLPFAKVLWFARAGSRLFSGFLLPGISLGYTRTYVCVCELVLVQAQTACLQRRARATRRPARRWYRHGAAGWAALGAGDGLALTTSLQSALWRTWRQKLPLTAADVAVIFGVLTSRGYSGCDVATAVVLIGPPKAAVWPREYYNRMGRKPLSN